MGRHVSLSSAFTVRCRCAQTAAAAPMRQRSCPACCACACPNCAPSHLRSASTHLWPSAACPAPAHPPSPAGCAPRARWRPPGRRRRPPPRGCEPRGGAPGCTAGRGSPPTAGGQAGRQAGTRSQQAARGRCGCWHTSSQLGWGTWRSGRPPCASCGPNCHCPNCHCRLPQLPKLPLAATACSCCSFCHAELQVCGCCWQQKQQQHTLWISTKPTRTVKSMSAGASAILQKTASITAGMTPWLSAPPGLKAVPIVYVLPLPVWP